MQNKIGVKKARNKKMKNDAEYKKIRSILEKFEPKKENLIPILHEIQNENVYNYISEDAIREVAEYLNLTHSEILGVISFYTMFSTKPRGRYIIRICKSAPCHVMNADSIIETVKKTLGIEIGETTKDELFTLELSSCLGLCDIAPAMMINDEVYGNLTPSKVKKILEEIRSRKY